MRTKSPSPLKKTKVEGLLALAISSHPLVVWDSHENLGNLSLIARRFQQKTWEIIKLSPTFFSFAPTFFSIASSFTKKQLFRAVPALAVFLAFCLLFSIFSRLAALKYKRMFIK